MSTCTISGHALVGGRALWTTCQACETRIATALNDVEQMWPMLADCLEPTRGHNGPRTSGSAVAPLPAAEHVLELIGPAGIPARLYWRYADIAVARGYAPARQPAGSDARLAQALRGIRRHLSWAVQAVDLTELDTVLRHIVGQLTRVTGGAAPAAAVPCPAELPDGSRCTGKLRYDDQQRTASCRTCRTDLDPSQWLALWVQLGQPA
uniref:Uncharacterized protein n=1 Tax=Streptomyces sp. FR1 TaxID=349971 RepID=I1VH34_9ACTN|nr:hypothetical protein [Streptomyces sp. FR1]AFI44032.1 hypothetical protein pFP4.33c [Streptomyces sp. FR1]